jgi:hypothetical protein
MTAVFAMRLQVIGPRPSASAPEFRALRRGNPDMMILPYAYRSTTSFQGTCCDELRSPPKCDIRIRTSRRRNRRDRGAKSLDVR